MTLYDIRCTWCRATESSVEAPGKGWVEAHVNIRPYKSLKMRTQDEAFCCFDHLREWLDEIAKLASEIDVIPIKRSPLDERESY